MPRPEAPWRATHLTVECAHEVRQVSEPDLVGHLGHRLPGGEQQVDRIAQPLADQELVRGHAHALVKEPEEVERAHAGFPGEILQTQGLPGVGTEVLRGDLDATSVRSTGLASSATPLSQPTCLLGRNQARHLVAELLEGQRLGRPARRRRSQTEASLEPWHGRKGRRPLLFGPDLPQDLIAQFEREATVAIAVLVAALIGHARAPDKKPARREDLFPGRGAIAKRPLAHQRNAGPVVRLRKRPVVRPGRAGDLP